jgi:hypothetical protein
LPKQQHQVQARCEIKQKQILPVDIKIFLVALQIANLSMISSCFWSMKCCKHFARLKKINYWRHRIKIPPPDFPSFSDIRLINFLLLIFAPAFALHFILSLSSLHLLTARHVCRRNLINERKERKFIYSCDVMFNEM